MREPEVYRRHFIRYLHEELVEIHGPDLVRPIVMSARPGENRKDLQARCHNAIDQREEELNQMELQAAIIAQIERDIASFQQGIDMMEKGRLASGYQKPCGVIVDTTCETLAWYRAKRDELTKLLAQYKR